VGRGFLWAANGCNSGLKGSDKFLQIQPVSFSNRFQRIKKGLAAEADARLLIIFSENRFRLPVSRHNIQECHIRSDNTFMSMYKFRHGFFAPEGLFSWQFDETLRL